jgi:hypothetical protein
MWEPAVGVRVGRKGWGRRGSGGGGARGGDGRDVLVRVYWGRGGKREVHPGQRSTTHNGQRARSASRGCRWLRRHWRLLDTTRLAPGTAAPSACLRTQGIHCGYQGGDSSTAGHCCGAQVTHSSLPQGLGQQAWPHSRLLSRSPTQGSGTTHHARGATLGDKVDLKNTRRERNPDQATHRPHAHHTSSRTRAAA